MVIPYIFLKTKTPEKRAPPLLVNSYVEASHVNQSSTEFTRRGGASVLGFNVTHFLKKYLWGITSGLPRNFVVDEVTSPEAGSRLRDS